MEIGSDLFNILITIGFLLFVLIILYLIRSIFLANKLKFELERVQNLRIFEINIPQEKVPAPSRQIKDFQEKIAVAEQFFSSLSSLYEGKIEKKIYNLQSQISFEIIALEGKVGFYCICPRQIEGIIERQINAYWPTSQVTKAIVPNIFQSQKGAMVSCELKLLKKFEIYISNKLKIWIHLICLPHKGRTF